MVLYPYLKLFLSDRIQVSNVWVIEDRNSFTNEEYDKLMTSHLRKQSFGPMVPRPPQVDDFLRLFIEGKNDYLTTDENYSDFDNSVLDKR